MRDEEIIEKPADQRTITKRYGNEAVTFIKNNKDKSFFLYLAHNMPHIPLFRSKEFEGRSLRGMYGDVIREIDWSVGRVLNTLQREGLSEDTFVLFTSDNGPWLTFKDHGGSAGLLRDGKGSTWEGGMREPCVAWWPGKIRGGRVIMEMASTLDLLPTCADIAGVEAPSDRVLDGYSMLDMLTGQGKSARDEMIYYRGEQIRAVRKGVWKMHLYTKTEYTGEKIVAHDPPLLYNLEHDPSEKYDIGEKHPDVIERLKKVLAKHEATVEKVPSQLEIKLEE
jgi:arylsulfatase A-like enzyme